MLGSLADVAGDGESVWRKLTVAGDAPAARINHALVELDGRLLLLHGSARDQKDTMYNVCIMRYVVLCLTLSLGLFYSYCRHVPYLARGKL